MHSQSHHNHHYHHFQYFSVLIMFKLTMITPGGPIKNVHHSKGMMSSSETISVKWDEFRMRPYQRLSKPINKRDPSTERAQYCSSSNVPALKQYNLGRNSNGLKPIWNKYFLNGFFLSVKIFSASKRHQKNTQKFHIDSWQFLDFMCHEVLKNQRCISKSQLRLWISSV